MHVSAKQGEVTNRSQLYICRCGICYTIDTLYYATLQICAFTPQHAKHLNTHAYVNRGESFSKCSKEGVKDAS